MGIGIRESGIGNSKAIPDHRIAIRPALPARPIAYSPLLISRAEYAP